MQKKRNICTKLVSLLLFGFLAISVLTPPAGAASPWTQEDNYGDKAAHKFGFGLRNVVLGWSEILTEPVQASKAGKDPVEGFFNGIGKALMRTIGGTIHTVTYLITPIDIPLPENGQGPWPFE